MRINWRSYWADTTAALIFWFFVNAFTELVIARMTWRQVLAARILGPLFYLPFARFYGIYRDWLVGSKLGQHSKVAADAIAFTTFEVGYYILLLKCVAHATWWQIVISSASLAFFTAITGRLYGLWLEWVRTKFKLKKDSS